MDQRRKLGERTSHSPKISLHGNSMEKYVFCDNIVFNDMPIYTSFLYLMLSVTEPYFVSAFIAFDCITAPPGGHLAL